ncbi:15130_t:CDS:2 [Funneliformis mosseae]|uniref:15130_t:CDS:1 n=1 Tax=Funneliformis mosseae TaxID=27381 RepID=A0A9N9G6E8_FUNMO|nr:15130_t:CDS:2 [Funneliformis mosseae]
MCITNNIDSHLKISNFTKAYRTHIHVPFKILSLYKNSNDWDER